MERDGLVFEIRASPRPGVARTYVLVPGVGMTHRSMARLHAQLSTDAAVYTLDLPGFASLPAPRRDVSVQQMADALAAVLDGESISDAVLVGHSMGAQWVIELALRRPDLASHVVAIGPVVDDRHRSLGAQALALGIDATRESVHANLIVITDYLRCSLRWYLAQVRHMLAYRTQRRARMLRHPVLLVRGDRDPVCGQDWLRRLRDAVPGSRLIVVPRRSHHVEHQAPGAVAAGIRAFVAEEVQGRA